MIEFWRRIQLDGATDHTIAHDLDLSARAGKASRRRATGRSTASSRHSFGHRVFDAVGEPRAGPGAGRLAAGLPNLGEIRTPPGCFGVPLHRRVRGPELLDVDRDVAEPAVDGDQPRGQVALAGPAGWPREGRRPGRGRPRNRCLRPGPASTVAAAHGRHRDPRAIANMERTSRSTSGASCLSRELMTMASWLFGLFLRLRPGA